MHKQLPITQDESHVHMLIYSL